VGQKGHSIEDVANDGPEGPRLAWENLERKGNTHHLKNHLSKMTLSWMRGVMGDE